MDRGQVVFIPGSEMDRELRKFSDSLYRLADETNRDFGDVVRQNARLVAVNFAFQTQPFGDGDKARQQGIEAVRRDISNVYRTPEIIFTQIQKQMKNGKGGPAQADRAARAFYGAVMKGNSAIAQQILRSLNIFDSGAAIGKFDKGAAHQQRRNRRGRVGSRRASLIVTNPKQLAAYVRKIENRVGFGKSGWAAAARDLGSTRGIPGWVTRKRGPGGARDQTRSTNNPHVVIHNDVTYIDQILTASQMAEALRIQREKMVKMIEIVIEKNARKHGFAKAA
jgi:hypothetical protein